MSHNIKTGFKWKLFKTDVPDFRFGISDISEFDPPVFSPTAVGYSPGCFMILKVNKNILVAVSLLARIAPRGYITATAAVLQLYSKITYWTNSKTSVKIC